VKDVLPLLFLPDPRFGAGRDRREMARSALRGGASSIQLRSKETMGEELVEEGRALGRICREFGRPFIVNDRVDVAVACGADGVHLGPDDTPPREARGLLGPDALIGISAYGPEDLETARDIGAAYVAVGAVFQTDTKRIETVGLDTLRKVREETDLPLVAIGGIRLANVEEVVAAGADGVAVVSALSAAAGIEEATVDFRARIDRALALRKAR